MLYQSGEASIVKRNGDHYLVNYDQGILNGLVTEELEREQLIRQVCYHRGYRHGVFREFCLVRKILLSFGRYHLGKKTGYCWSYTKGGSFLVGEMIQNKSSEYTCHGDVVFIYPDLITALSCNYDQGKMTRGTLVHVNGLEWNSGIPHPSTVIPPYVKNDSFVYSYEPSGSLCISRNPMLRDAFELRYAYVGESMISGNAGEGLFAKTDIKQGSLVALFNGVRQHKICGQFDSKNWSDYRIECTSEIDLDILPGQEKLCNYNATLGHKVNNSFNNNCGFNQFWHPRLS